MRLHHYRNLKINLNLNKICQNLIKDKKRSIKHNVEDPNIQFVRNEIESKLGLNVQIVNKKNNSGKVIIEYKTLEQFDLISKKRRK